MPPMYFYLFDLNKLYKHALVAVQTYPFIKAEYSAYVFYFVVLIFHFIVYINDALNSSAQPFIGIYSLATLVAVGTDYT
jgi:hypothetical protein